MGASSAIKPLLLNLQPRKSPRPGAETGSHYPRGSVAPGQSVRRQDPRPSAISGSRRITCGVSSAQSWMPRCFRMDQNQEIFARYMNDLDFAKVVAEFLRKQVYKQIRAEAKQESVQPG